MSSLADRRQNDPAWRFAVELQHASTRDDATPARQARAQLFEGRKTALDIPIFGRASGCRCAPPYNGNDQNAPDRCNGRIAASEGRAADGGKAGRRSFQGGPDPELPKQRDLSEGPDGGC
jgi:hypothetical protein